MNNNKNTNKYSLLKALLIIFSAAISFHTQGILIRHDVEPEKYLATLEEFPALATFYIDGAHAVLIEPKWLLTAAHATFCLTAKSKIKVGTQTHQVNAVHIHPDYTPGLSHDIALVELASSVTGIQPAKLYPDIDEAGKAIWFIGIGGTGNGISGITVDNYQNNGVLRKAQNLVETAEGPIVTFRFDQGQQALPLEGISGGGDSGGPAFIRDNNDFWVLGISSRYGGGPSEKYTSLEVYSRVSYFVPWITQVIQNEADSYAQHLSLPKLKSLPAGVTPETLPQICSDIEI